MSVSSVREKEWGMEGAGEEEEEDVGRRWVVRTRAACVRIECCSFMARSS